MSKPMTPVIEKWIEENKPQTSDDIYEIRSTITKGQVTDWEIGAQMTAKYILEELGVLECLEFYKNLPMSEQDQLWTQKLADECISNAKETLEKLGVEK